MLLIQREYTLVKMPLWNETGKEEGDLRRERALFSIPNYISGPQLPLLLQSLVKNCVAKRLKHSLVILPWLCQQVIVNNNNPGAYDNARRHV